MGVTVRRPRRRRGGEVTSYNGGRQEAPAAAMANIMSPQCNCGAHVWCKMSLANHSDKMGLLWLWAAVWRLAKYKNTARQQNSQTDNSPFMLARVDSTMLLATPTGDSLMEKSCAKKIWLPQVYKTMARKKVWASVRISYSARTLIADGAHIKRLIWAGLQSAVTRHVEYYPLPSFTINYLPSGVNSTIALF